MRDDKHTTGDNTNEDESVKPKSKKKLFTTRQQKAESKSTGTRSPHATTANPDSTDEQIEFTNTTRSLFSLSGTSASPTLGLDDVCEFPTLDRRETQQPETVEPWPSPKKTTKGYTFENGILNTPKGGKYSYVKELGQGEYGAVDLYESKHTGQKRVVKRQLTPDTSFDPGKRRKTSGGKPRYDHDEAWKEHNNTKKAGKKSGLICPSGHPHRQGSRFCDKPHSIVQDYIPGITLKNYLTQYIFVLKDPTEAINRLLTKLNNCVTAYHIVSQQMHCDLKEDNIMVRNPNDNLADIELELIDYGSAANFATEEEIADGKAERVDTSNVNALHYKGEFLQTEIPKPEYDLQAVKSIIAAMRERSKPKASTQGQGSPTPYGQAKVTESPMCKQRQNAREVLGLESPKSPDNTLVPQGFHSPGYFHSPKATRSPDNALAPQGFYSPECFHSPKAARSPRSPDNALAPQSFYSPGCFQSPKATRSSKSPQSPRSPRSPEKAFTPQRLFQPHSHCSSDATAVNQTNELPMLAQSPKS